MLDSEDDKDEVYESLHWGVDTMSHSTDNHPKPPYFRDRKKRLITVPVYSQVRISPYSCKSNLEQDYRNHCCGRNKKKRWSTPEGAPFLSNEPIGFRPVLATKYRNLGSNGHFQTPKKTKECEETVFDILTTWQNMRTIKRIGSRSLNDSANDLSTTILPLIVERSKPRLVT